MDVQGIQAALNQVRGGGTPRPDSLMNEQDPLREVAKEFEALFIEMMFDSMRETVDREHSLFDGGYAEEVFEDMLYEQYSLIMADSGGTGLADMIYDQLSEQSGPAASSGAEAARPADTETPERTNSPEPAEAPADIRLNQERLRAYDSLQPELP